MRRSVVTALVPLVLVAGLLTAGSAGSATAGPRPDPVRLEGSSVPEDAPVGTRIGRLSAGPGVRDFRLVNGPGSRDNESVGIAGRRLLVDAPLDHETRSELRVRVRATTDEGRRRVGRFTIEVRDVDESGRPAATLLPTAR